MYQDNILFDTVIHKAAHEKVDQGTENDTEDRELQSYFSVEYKPDQK